MKKIIRIITPIICAILLGYFFGNLMFNQYNKTITVNANNDYIVTYFIQVGAYSTYETMIDNTKNFEHYIYLEEDGFYKVFLGLTGKEENTKKIIEYLKNNNIDSIVKEYKLNNLAFKEVLEQYDNMLLLTDDSKQIETITKQVLSKYQEYEAQ